MVEVVDLILAMVVCCGLQLVMGFKSGCGDCWWMGERERQIWTWQTQFWVFRSKPSIEIVHAIKASNCSFVWVVGKTFICWRDFVMVCL